MSKSWGYHLILDCKVVENKKVKRIYEGFVIQLVEEIDMVAYGQPMIEHFATHDEDKAGWSLVQLIETSSITGHFVDKNGDFYLDLFSCKEFDIDKTTNFVKDYLEPKNIKQTYLLRQSYKRRYENEKVFINIRNGFSSYITNGQSKIV